MTPTKPIPRAIYAALLTTGFFCCASTDYGQRTPGQEINDARSTEAGFVLQMREAEDDLKRSGAVNEDPELNAYIGSVACKVAGEFCNELRVYIVEIPIFNASMAPNGMMMVHSGLLLRADNEAELAFVLAHEFGHYFESHSIERWGAWKNANNAGVVLGATIGAVGGVALGSPGAALGDTAYILSASTAFSFSREQEHEADKIGLQIIGDLGYSPQAGVSIWQNLSNEMRASSNKSKRRSLNKASLFNTHPLTSQRIASLDQMSTQWSGGTTRSEIYQAAVRPHLERWLKAELANRDPGAMLHLLDRLSARGEDAGKIEFYRGEVYRTRRQEGDQTLALEAYEGAVGFADVPAIAWRQIGDLSARLGDPAKARSAFQEYLTKAPDAADRALIEAMLKDL
ncbi:MAG: M48 family metalloprotease [Pseudomonadota bacterium]